MPKKKSATQKKVSRAMREVFTNPPKGVTSKRQKVAIALSKARAAGARIPKKTKKR